MPELIGLDVTGIQRFIFASNRLRDVVSASEIIEHETGLGGLRDAGVREDEVVIAAGGNATLVVADQGRARDLISAISRRFIDQLPGLDVVLCRQSYGSGELAPAMLYLQEQIVDAKFAVRPTAPGLNLAVAARCAVTGAEATALDRNHIPVCRPVELMRRRESDLTSPGGWASLLGGPDLWDGWVPEFPAELDRLGRTRGDRSLIGVVHVDGNGIGSRLSALLDQAHDEARDDDWLRGRIRDFSVAMRELAWDALARVVHRIRDRVATVGGDPTLSGRFAELDFVLSHERRRGEVDATVMLPIRPILVGGDDITFVCDGRVALDLAATAARVFQTSERPALGDDPVSACAGVAIVRAHTPFIRAYELAEGLCRSAKIHRTAQKWTDGAIDWHIGAAPPGVAIDQLRTVGRATCRPYRIGPTDESDEVDNFTWLGDTLLGADEGGLRHPMWSDRRSKIRRLADATYEGHISVDRGRTAVNRRLDAWRVVTPDLRLPVPIHDGFTSDQRSPLLDAVELLDRHQILDKERG